VVSRTVASVCVCVEHLPSYRGSGSLHRPCATKRFMENSDDEVGLNADDGPSRRLMEMIDENSEMLGSKVYVDLANIAGEFSKLERRANRMRKKLTQEFGSDCSAFIPSDDEGDVSIGYDDYEDSDPDGDPSSESSSEVGNSNASTQSSDIIHNFKKGRVDQHVIAAPSGYYTKYMGDYYSIPRDSIKRCYSKPFVITGDGSVDEIKKLTKRGSRAKSWIKYLVTMALRPHHIVVLEMKHREKTNVYNTSNELTANKCDYVWGVILSVDGTEAQDACDHRIVHILPESIVCNLKKRYSEDEELKNTTLLSTFLPGFLKISTYCPRECANEQPIPGPSRKRKIRGADDADTDFYKENGNWWEQAPLSRKVRSVVDVSSRRYTIKIDSDEE